MSTYSSFDLTIDSGVAHLVLGNAAKMNALARAFWVELPQAVAELDRGGNVRALVISSTGPIFCSGIDLSIFGDQSLGSVATPAERERLKHLVLRLQDSLSCLHDSRFPVLVAVQGACLGAGLDLISACDMRWGTADSFYVIQEINLGIMADLGSLQRLPQLLPDAVLRELAFTGSKLSADRAYGYGFLNGVVENHEDAIATALQAARTIAQKSPLAVAGSKQCLNYAVGHSLAESLDFCATLQSAIFDPADVMAQVMAMKTKTPHQTKDLLVVKGLSG